MKIIKQMLEDQKNGKRIYIKDYYDDEMKFYDEFEIYKLLNLQNSLIQKELNILIATVKQNSNNRLFFFDKKMDGELDYVRVFQKLLVLYHKDKQIAYEEAFKYIKAPREFNKLLIDFKSSFINAELYINDLATISNYVYNNTEYPKKNTNSIDKLKKENYNILLDKILNSNLSIIDYSYYYPLDDDFNIKTLSTFEKIDKEKYEEIANRKDTTINQILYIIERINKNDLTVLEYYELTKLNPILLNRIATQHKMKTHFFREFHRKLTNSKKISLREELKNYMIISSIEVDEQTKIQAYEILTQKQIPVNQLTYKATIRKLVKEK